MYGGLFDSGHGRKREYISKADIDKILERQHWKCAMCGKPLKPGRFHIDHKVPLALGGSNSIRNLQALCPDCHHIKTKQDRKKIAQAKKKKKEESFGSFEISPPFIVNTEPKSRKRKTKKRRNQKQDEFGFWI